MLRIEKEKLAQYEIIEFKGEIITISDNSELKKIEVLKNEKIIGIDSESKPMFKRGKIQKLDLIQLSTHSICFLIQVKKLTNLILLHEILTSTNIQKIGVSLDDDIKKIRDFVGCELENYIDLAKMAKSKGIIQSGARNLTARYLERRLSKSQQTSNWSNDLLSKRQKIYASTDAWICLEIYPRLLSDKTDYKKLLRIEEDELNSNGNDIIK